MTAATAEALAKTLNALVREGWDEPSSNETPEDRRKLERGIVEVRAAIIELLAAVRVREHVPPAAS
jgi:hypothetical protein